MINDMKTAFVLLLLCLSAGSILTTAPANSAEPVAETGSAAERIRPLSITPSNPIYPESLYSQGVQGTVDILVHVGPDGAPSDVSVQQTSRSAELDAIALKLVKGLKFGAADGGKTQALPPIVVPVEFSRDTATKLSEKTCRDLNIDVEYQKRTFPEAVPQDLSIIKLTVGMVFLTNSRQLGGDQLVNASRKTSAAAKDIIAVCSANPDANFLQSFQALVARP